jgi:hypothetical protein
VVALEQPEIAVATAQVAGRDTWTRCDSQRRVTRGSDRLGGFSGAVRMEPVLRPLIRSTLQDRTTADVVQSRGVSLFGETDKAEVRASRPARPGSSTLTVVMGNATPVSGSTRVSLGRRSHARSCSVARSVWDGRVGHGSSFGWGGGGPDSGLSPPP